MINCRVYKEFTAEQNKSALRTIPYSASKAFRATGFGRAEFPIDTLVSENWREARQLKIYAIFEHIYAYIAYFMPNLAYL